MSSCLSAVVGYLLVAPYKVLYKLPFALGADRTHPRLDFDYAFEGLIYCRGTEMSITPRCVTARTVARMLEQSRDFSQLRFMAVVDVQLFSLDLLRD